MYMMAYLVHLSWREHRVCVTNTNKTQELTQNIVDNIRGYISFPSCTYIRVLQVILTYHIHVYTDVVHTLTSTTVYLSTTSKLCCLYTTQHTKRVHFVYGYVLHYVICMLLKDMWYHVFTTLYTLTLYLRVNTMRLITYTHGTVH